jgi:hypothetical protein
MVGLFCPLFSLFCQILTTLHSQMSAFNEQYGNPHDNNMPTWTNMTLSNDNQAIQTSPAGVYRKPVQLF